MGSRVFIFLGLLFAIAHIASEVSARELAGTKQKDQSDGVEESKPLGGIGNPGYRGRVPPYRGGIPGYGGRGGPPGYGGGGEIPGGGGGGEGGEGEGYCEDKKNCCESDTFCLICCVSIRETEGYGAAQAKTKPQN